MGRWRRIGRLSWHKVLYARSRCVTMDFCRGGVASTVSGYSDVFVVICFFTKASAASTFDADPSLQKVS